MVNEAALLERRLSQKGSSTPERVAVAPAVLEGEKIESIATQSEWGEWFDQEARIYDLPKDRRGDIELARSFTAVAATRNFWRGASVRLGKAEEHNRVQPRCLSFKEAVEDIKRLASGARVTPLVQKYDRDYEQGLYQFSGESGEGIIIIDDDSVQETGGVAYSGLLPSVTQSLVPVGVGQTTSLVEAVPEVDLEKELERLTTKLAGRRFTLTAIVYKKPVELEVSPTPRDVSQEAEQVSSTAPFESPQQPVNEGPAGEPFSFVSAGPVNITFAPGWDTDRSN